MMQYAQSTLSDSAILHYMQDESIVISPFIKTNLNTSSYDVTLGEYYFTQNLAPTKDMVSSSTRTPIYNPYDETHVRHVWEGPFQAQKAEEFMEQNKIHLKGVKPADRIILIKPHETILAHTQEFIGGQNKRFTSMMKARSSIGRNFLEVCKCAGWGDVGYINRWTMEITNNANEFSIPLVVGRRIAQIVFFQVDPILDKEYAEGGKYQTKKDIHALMKAWSPDDMLPKMWKDREINS